MAAHRTTRTTFWTTVAIALVAIMMSDSPAIGIAHANAADDASEAARDATYEAILGPLIHASTNGPTTGLPGFRDEADGSVTVLGSIEDDPAPMTRTRVDLAAAATILGIDDPGYAGGIFTRTWHYGDEPITTVGIWFENEDGSITNMNLLALEGTKGADRLVMEAVERDGVPIALNTLPFVLNYAHPTSLVAVIGLTLGIIAIVAVMAVLATLGASEAAIVLYTAYVFMIYAPIFGANVLYPYHTDYFEGEVYRDFPDTYIWRGVKRVAGGDVWDGVYLSRYGAYAESIKSGADGSVSLIADAWKRVVVGPATRINGNTGKHPGVYIREDIHRAFIILPASQEFEAESHITVGAFHETVGESPGATARFHESKRGDQTFFYVPEQEDTISFGVTTDDGYVPLIGTRTSSWHRNYQDRTNLGATIDAIESYRLTSFGFFAADNDDYIPVFGADYWGERFPTDLWALSFGLGQGLGDQNVGDIMVRSGIFAGDNFVPIVGARVDDDFQGHLHDYRTMVSAGVFRANPLDPGDGTPGESPDDAQYVPLVGTTYDGVQGSTPWALANVGDNPDGMGTFRLSSGIFVIDAYKPLVGADYQPGAWHGERRAQETYRVGIFPADYSRFIPVAQVQWDGDQTTAAHAQNTAFGHTAAAREGEGDATAGVLVGETFIPIAGIRYTPSGTDTVHPYGHAFEAGYFQGGDFQSIGRVTVGFPGHATSWAQSPDSCDASVRVEAAGQDQGATRAPCITG